MIEKSVLLPLVPQQAFDLFTAQIDSWWPADRRHLNDVHSQVFLLSSGRFYERARDGTELDLGRVRLWDPPRRVILDFFVGTDAARPTEVTIGFSAEGDATRVSVSHRPGASSIDAWNTRAPVFGRSWDAVLNALSLRSKR